VLQEPAGLVTLAAPCFARTEPWLQAGKYAAAEMNETGDVSPGMRGTGPRTRPAAAEPRELDTFAAMAVVRRLAVTGAGPGAGGADAAS